MGTLNHIHMQLCKHVMALLWCIATCVLFGVGMCAPRCREDNKCFMVGLLICCSLWALCDLIATSLFGYYVYPGHSPPRGVCHSYDPDYGACVNASITFGFLLFGLINSAACCAFAGVACCVKEKSKEARLEAENSKPRRRPQPRRQERNPTRQRERSPRRRERTPRRRERTPTYYYYDDDYYYY